MRKVPDRFSRIMPLSKGMLATAHTLTVNILILGLNLGTGIITARVLGPDGRGAQAAMQMWPQLLAMALTLGLPTSLVYNLRRYPEKGPQLFSASLCLGTGMGVVAMLTGMVLVPRWLTEYPQEVVRFTQWLMLAAPLALLTISMSNILRAREEFAAFNAVRYLQPVLTLLILVSLVLADGLTPFNAALAYVVPFGPLFLWLVIRLSRTYRPTARGLRAASRSLLSYGVRSYGVDLLGQLVAGRLDRVLVVGLLNPAAMGLYVVAYSLSRTIDAFPAAVAQVILPKAASRPVEEVVALIGRGVRVSTSLSLLAGVVLAVLGPWALELVYGREFLSAVPIFRLLMAEVVLSGATWVLAQAFMASDKPGMVSIMQGIGVALTVPLLLVLVPRYGLMGAGSAVLISTAIRFTFAMASFPITLGTRPPRLWPRWDDFSALIRIRSTDD